jgi:hypothetical protein
MKRALLLLLSVGMAFGLMTAPAGAAFGLRGLDFSSTDAEGGIEMLAGMHPTAVTTSVAVNSFVSASGQEFPDGQIKNLSVELPAGLVGNPTAVPRCTEPEFSEIVENNYTKCPNSTAVGVSGVKVELVPFSVNGEQKFFYVPVYNLSPPPGYVAEFGFVVLSIPVKILVGVNERPPYNVVATVSNISQVAFFYGAELSLWGNPASPAHDALRGTCIDSEHGTPGEIASRGSCPVENPESAFLTLPRSCIGPLTTRFEATSWQSPGAPPAVGEATTHDESAIPRPAGFGGCSRLGFGPKITSTPTSDSASSPSGLDFDLDVDDEGLTSPIGTAQSDVKTAEVTLPEGVTINPAQAEGLGVCSEADLARETAKSEFGAGCPASSKIGTVEVETPLLEGQLLKGSLFVATPYENPFHSLVALYMTIKDPQLGISINLPGEVVPDPHTGQLVSTFGGAGQELPQLPFSHFHLHFRGGQRSPLVTPPACGTYVTKAVLTPWADPAASYATSSSFTIDSGVGGAPCPSGSAGFHPGFEAGSVNNAAATYSPFVMRLTRQDSEQDLTKFSSILPPGLVGKIAGIPYCSEAGIAQARSRQGQDGGTEERTDPSCPAASQIGTTIGGAGVGSQLTYVPGKVYLAGPFQGDPLSVVAITPAVAGPFDAGTVVVREALTLNPLTAEVEVDGSASEPIPHILKGIPLNLRDLRVHVDRPEFTLNPTSCEEEQTRAILFGGGTALAPLADDPVDLSARFQAASCASLAFKPKLKIQLKGATKRIGHPGLKAVVTYPKRGAYANIASAQVNLPHGEFLDQGNLNKTCTRPVLLAGNCPKSSVYGHAKAWTPLLDNPLQGPVYLVGGFGYKLPALVAELNGQFRILLVSKVDSGKNKGIRSTFQVVPDAPVSRFVLEMKGGKKYGLLENSENLCKRPQRGIARFRAQNGRVLQWKPVIGNDCRKKGKGKKSKTHKKNPKHKQHSKAKRE